MSSKTKILVLKSRNLIWTAVILVIVILLAILLVSALQLDKKQSQTRSLAGDITFNLLVQLVVLFPLLINLPIHNG